MLQEWYISNLLIQPSFARYAKFGMESEVMLWSHLRYFLKGSGVSSVVWEWEFVTLGCSWCCPRDDLNGGVKTQPKPYSLQTKETQDWLCHVIPLDKWQNLSSWRRMDVSRDSTSKRKKIGNFLFPFSQGKMRRMVPNCDLMCFVVHAFSICLIWSVNFDSMCDVIP